MKYLRKIEYCIKTDSGFSNWKSWICGNISLSKEVELLGDAQYKDCYNDYIDYLDINKILFEKNIFLEGGPWGGLDNSFIIYNTKDFDEIETEEEFRKLIKITKFNKSFEDHMS